MHLIDTSAWIEYLRGTDSDADDEVDRLLQKEPTNIAITEPIVMELLAGTTSPSKTSKVEQLTSGIRLLPVDGSIDFHNAATVYRTARAAGTPIRSMVDCLIAAVAMRTGATVVHRDRDYEHLVAALPDLRAKSLR